MKSMQYNTSNSLTLKLLKCIFFCCFIAFYTGKVLCCLPDNSDFPYFPSQTLERHSKLDKATRWKICNLKQSITSNADTLASAEHRKGVQMLISLMDANGFCQPLRFLQVEVLQTLPSLVGQMNWQQIDHPNLR